jgi:hypothetical protein
LPLSRDLPRISLLHSRKVGVAVIVVILTALIVGVAAHPAGRADIVMKSRAHEGSKKVDGLARPWRSRPENHCPFG